MMKIVPCRKCGKSIPISSNQCPYCNASSPGIDTKCPACGSKDYKWSTYGFSAGKALGGAILLGPVGLAAGLIGSGKIECICKKCGQGWFPDSPVGGIGSMTRKHKI